MSRCGKGVAIAHRGQTAFEIVGPGVIGADDAAGADAARTIEQARGAMTAHVVERAHRAVVAAQREQHLADEVETLVVAGLRDLGDVADHLPGRAENAFALEREEFGDRCTSTTGRLKSSARMLMQLDNKPAQAAQPGAAELSAWCLKARRSARNRRGAGLRRAAR